MRRYGVIKKDTADNLFEALSVYFNESHVIPGDEVARILGKDALDYVLDTGDWDLWNWRDDVNGKSICWLTRKGWTIAVTRHNQCVLADTWKNCEFEIDWGNEE